MTSNRFDRIVFKEHPRTSEACWFTNFNDLRLLVNESGRTRSVWESELAREVKMALMFRSKSLIVSDTDFLNNPIVHGLFMHDRHGFRSAIENGRIVLALRRSAGGLVALNEKQHKQRANAKMFDTAKPFAEKFDTFLGSRSVVVADWDLSQLASGFAARVRAFAADTETSLSGREHEILRSGIQHAEQADDGALFFGRMYPYFVEECGLDPSSGIIQAVRTAHLVTPSQALRLPTSAGIDDLNPTIAARMINANVGKYPTPEFIERWSEIVPAGILPQALIDSWPMSRVVAAQQVAERVGYWEALAAAEASLGTNVADEEYLDYLRALDRYLTALGIEFNIELVNWQKRIAGRRLAALDDKDTRRYWYFWLIPVAVGGTVVIAQFHLIALGTAIWAAGRLLAKPVEAIVKRGTDPERKLLETGQLGLPRTSDE